MGFEERIAPDISVYVGSLKAAIMGSQGNNARRNPNWPHNLLTPRNEAGRILDPLCKRISSAPTKFSTPVPPGTRDARKTLGDYGDGTVAWAGGDESAL